MPTTIKYTYLKQQTWLYRRNYPRDLQGVLGAQALKQSLKTGDAKLAKARSAEVNAKYEEIVRKARDGIVAVPAKPPAPVRVAPAVFSTTCPVIGRDKVAALARLYLNKRSDELRPGGFKSVRFSIGLLDSLYGTRQIGSLTRDDGKTFIRLISELAPHVGKSERTRGYGLERLVALSRGQQDRITVQTQKRIFHQVQHFLDWAVYEGHVAEAPFRTIRLDQKGRVASYAVPTDQEVRRLLSVNDPRIGAVLQFCLLTGMRAGEAAGLLREDILDKGNLGLFAWIRPNRVRNLKTDAAERVVPLHSVLMDRLDASQEVLFPNVTVPAITKGFAKLRQRAGVDRPGLVFHSSRKWFVTQCERTGVPEHFTASLVGHQSARSENRLTYSIYSGGISDAQKREIVDGIRLPDGVS